MEINDFYTERKRLLCADIDTLTAELNEEKNKINIEKDNVKSNIDKFQHQMDELNFFQRKKKKEIQHIIEAYKKQLAEYEDRLNDLTYSFNQKINAVKDMIMLVNPSVGSTIKLGKEPFSDGYSDLEWNVVENNGKVITLLSTKTLSHLSYYQAEKWLADDFVKNVFSQKEIELLNKKSAELPTPQKIGEFTAGQMGTCPTTSLRNKLVADRTADGNKYRYSRAQIQNSINYTVESSYPYWLHTTDFSGGFAEYVGRSTQGGWICGRIGVGAPFGVRAVIKVDNFKLSNFVK